MTVKNLQLIKELEGCRLESYPDGGGVWTIGYGHTNGVKPGQSCTEIEAEGFLKEDLSLAERDVNQFVKVPLTQNQFDALVFLAFNIGGFNFRTSTLLKRLNEKDYTSASGEFLRWKFIKGKESKGLLNRRLKEQALFNE